MAKLNASEIKILNDIAAWKGQAPGFLSRATDFISRPINWATSTLIPDFVKQGMGGIVEVIAEKLQDASLWTVNKEEVLRSTKEFDIDSETIVELQKASIHDLDHISEKFISENRRYATLSGVGTGMVGWPGLIADLPTLFMISIRTIYQIGLCYGYEMSSESPEKQEFEMEFVMRIFKTATASSVAEKQKALAELKDFEISHQEVFQSVGGDFTSKQVSKNAANFLSQRLIKEIVEQTISKKAAGLVPGIGAIFNAGFNYVYLKDVGETAFMLYRERFLSDKKGRQKVIIVDIE